MEEPIIPKLEEIQRNLDIINENVTQGQQNIVANVMIAVPNMVDINAMLVQKLFFYAQNPNYRIRFHILSEVRHHDHARNRITEAFLSMPDCQYLYMIDADVDPHQNMLELIKLDKDIIAGNVFCWINGKLIPSIWQRAECEQCRCLGIWLNEKKIHDASQYRIGQTGMLQRWNPFRQQYQDYASDVGVLENQGCRCLGTGLDPWVYRMHERCVGQPTLMECDSVGAAAVIIARRVMEKVQMPWFSFLYKENREMLLTEDHFFCWRAKLEGFQVWADPQMAASHYKRIDLLQVNTNMVQAFVAGGTNAIQQNQALKNGKSDIILPSHKEISLVKASSKK